MTTVEDLLDGVPSMDELSIDEQLDLDRMVDMLSVMAYQSGADPYQQLDYFLGHVSEKAMEGFDQSQTVGADSVNIKVNTNARTEYDVEHPATAPPATRRQISTDIADYASVPDIAIQETVERHYVAELGIEHPAETVHVQFIKRGNRAEKLRKMTGLSVANPYEIITDDLMARGILEPDDRRDFSKRARSTLAVERVVMGNGDDHRDLHESGKLTPILEGVAEGKFWKDVAEPVELTLGADGKHQQGRIFRLKEHGEIIGV